MSVIDDFMTSYSKEYDFYNVVCEKIEKIVSDKLRSAGIRAIVSSRAKSPLRLKTKIEKRNISKKYKNAGDIQLDIPDLAGIRVAIYFPADSKKVDEIIKNEFEVHETKCFPNKDSEINKYDDYSKRFSGYLANHYRISLKDEATEDVQRYNSARAEIQVASVLMHAWSEVEHDLVYKPLQGKLSREEYMILDEINGLMLAGEIALERLQRSGELRTSEKNYSFKNHFELASHIIKKEKFNLDRKTGDFEILFKLVNELDFNKTSNIDKLLENIAIDTKTNQDPDDTKEFKQKDVVTTVIETLIDHSGVSVMHALNSLFMKKELSVESMSNFNRHFRRKFSTEFSQTKKIYSKIIIKKGGEYSFKTMLEALEVAPDDLKEEVDIFKEIILLLSTKLQKFNKNYDPQSLNLMFKLNGDLNKKLSTYLDKLENVDK